MKEIRCKKCNKLLAIIEGTIIEIKGKTNVKITKDKFKFKCILCKATIDGSVN